MFGNLLVACLVSELELKSFTFIAFHAMKQKICVFLILILFKIAHFPFLIAWNGEFITHLCEFRCNWNLFSSVHCSHLEVTE